MLYVGTSGWSYKHWGKTFYPEGLAAREQLVYLARHFPTVELNASFYRLPAEKTFAHWHDITPPEFRFAVKVPRIVTHLKRLDNVQNSWQDLLDQSGALGDKLGVYLLQFPPSFKADGQTLDRFEAFLDLAHVAGRRLAFELRHASWFEQPQLELLRSRKICLVQAESSRYPHSPSDFSPASFAYFRFHGPRQLYGSQYTDDELASWADIIKHDLQDGKDVYVYFDNDMHGYAIEDARRLKRLLT
jgi:uncharacterized protein YecE (DUF72 family)